MSPIWVGIIGLSARAKTSWASKAHLPYLQSSQNKYIITALCNSSLAAAQSAIAAYNLPASTKAYDRSCGVHHDTIKPSLVKGKEVYCEWPLASTLAEAEELHALANKNNARTMIGLQGQLSPIILKVKSPIEHQNRIGKVLSSFVVASGGTSSRSTLSEGLKYFTKKDVGGNMVTIGFAHMIDVVELVLGEFLSFNSLLSIQRPQVPIRSGTGEITETVTTNVADHIMLQGTLTSGAPCPIVFRRGTPFKETPGFIWSIHGEQGEIRITAAGPALQAGDGGKVEVESFETNEVDLIQWQGHFEDLPPPAKNVAAMYEAFAERQERYPDFEHAVLKHKQIEEVFRSSS